VGWLVAAGCYAPSYDYGDGQLRCDLAGACPPGYSCLPDLRCHKPGTPADAPMGGGPADAPPIGAVCSGSQTSCASAQKPEHCVGGQWVVDDACGADTPICDRGTCVVACTAPATRCRDERTPESCNSSGGWDVQSPCQFACLAESGACGGECIPFTDECRNGNELWECGRDGQWALKQTCPIACDAASCGGDCQTNDTRCSPSDPNVPETCLAGHWQDQAPCALACLPSGTCAPECDPAGPPTCISGDAYQCGADGHWTLKQTCSGNCSQGSCTAGACSDGATQCAANQTPETCQGGAWVDGTPCAFLCSGGACVVTECHPNVDTKCEAGFPYSCDAAGHWVKGSACMFVCDGNQCGGVCAPGSFRCNGAMTREECAGDGKSWALDQTCPFGCSGTTCNACTPDPNACSGKCGMVVNNCGATVDCGDHCAAQNGPAWSCGAGNTCTCARNVGADCAGKCGTITDRCGFSVNCSAAGNGGVACNGAGQVCQSNNGCCTQESIDVTCSGDPGDDCGASVPNNCGVTVTCSTACDAGFTCGAATPKKCGCQPGTIRCAGDVAETCDAAGTAWGNDTTCTTACIDGTGCGMCMPGTTACCDGTEVKTCGANGTYGACTPCGASTPACRANEKTCGGVCAPGAKMCGTDGSGDPAVLQCDGEGQWTIVVQTCAFTCTGGSTSPACTGECRPGDKVCVGDTLKTCGADFMYASQPCSNHCGTPAGGSATCCTETDSSMCPGTGGAACNSTVTKPSCGVPVSCGATCTGGFTCGGNAATPNLCSCSPGTSRCLAETGSGGQVNTCNANGISYGTPQFCFNGCTGSACCTDDATFCMNGRYCAPRSYCNRTAACGIDCNSTFPTMPTCGAVIAGQCGCAPATLPCNEGRCDSSGTFHPGTGCGTDECCCNGTEIGRASCRERV